MFQKYAMNTENLKAKKKNIVEYLHKILNNNVMQFLKESNKYIIDKLHSYVFSIFMSF